MTSLAHCNYCHHELAVHRADYCRKFNLSNDGFLELCYCTEHLDNMEDA